MQIKKHIPNIITLLNLFCGCIALVCLMNDDFVGAFYFVCLGIFLDFFDGFFARLFKVSSPLGLQLDSLADMVTSGVVPGLVMFLMMLKSYNTPPIVGVDPHLLYATLGFIITLGSCYRLANFNIDTRQTDSFIGLPTPANSLFIAALPFVISANIFGLGSIFQSQWFLIIFPFVSAYLLVAEIPLFALKFKSFAWQNNQLRYIFLLCCLISLFAFGYLGINISIVLYILFSIYNNLKTTK